MSDKKPDLTISPDVQWLLQEMDKKIEAKFDGLNTNITHLENTLTTYNNTIEGRFNRHWGIFKGVFGFFALCGIALITKSFLN